MKFFSIIFAFSSFAQITFDSPEKISEAKGIKYDENLSKFARISRNESKIKELEEKIKFLEEEFKKLRAKK